MTNPMYTNSVPVFKQLLTALKANLAQAHISVLPPGMGSVWDSTQLWHSPSLWEMPG